MSSAVVTIVFVALWVCRTAYVQSVIASKLWPIFTSFFFPEVVTGRWQDWGGLDYTAGHKIWVSLISVTKWQETNVNKCHEHILQIIFIIYYWFTYIFYILIFIL